MIASSPEISLTMRPFYSPPSLIYLPISLSRLLFFCIHPKEAEMVEEEEEDYVYCLCRVVPVKRAQ